MQDSWFSFVLTLLPAGERSWGVHLGGFALLPFLLSSLLPSILSSPSPAPSLSFFPPSISWVSSTCLPLHTTHVLGPCPQERFEILLWLAHFGGFPGDASGKKKKKKNHLPVQETSEGPFRYPGGDGPLEDSLTTHSSFLAWRIPWTEEPGGLQSLRSQRVRHDWSDLAPMHACTQKCPRCPRVHAEVNPLTGSSRNGLKVKTEGN